MFKNTEQVRLVGYDAKHMAAIAICYMNIKRSRIASMLFGLKPKAKKIALPLEARM
ncbi:hypothetical protein GJV09_16800 [Enterobacteriaceae bacterium RIT702]|nr:hypothetical protein [Enterobacteriaceae bacterium RIT702]